ncbi:branched-chain amino acid ABC transporter permease [Dehalogenimonas etheniformans]|uniref:Branched-chain amino acid ABC transporter permease n=1 Tax=Dehalogenimonas etheniformans TaxID=1536648 RepID=A0A2P5P6K7_9CHLR|nr:branched-chain amino acid ABC transporter permease [Dehalogenimonas etheniformans]PPD57925.1 branched-chain amino acid ABC transporter permease [Dehalogenimonas etheniformans]QNT75423.1 branched-chain amino acid ABC transporter permease [Dehalogenimonas etheniformans]
MDPILVYILNALVYVGIFSIVALSLNAEYGYTGLASFGKVAYFMIGAYGFAILVEAGIPWPVAIILAAIIASFFGLLVALPAIRLREDYLAIVTLTFGEILRIFIKAEDWLANGVWGISVPPSFATGNFSNQLIINIILVGAVLIICYFFMRLLANSPFGRIMRALRDDETAADAIGKNRVKYKAQVFMIGSAMAGVGGALFANFIGYITPDSFLPIITFTIWMMVILGGPGSNIGVIIGAAAVQLFERGTIILKDYIHLPIDPTNVQNILFGLIIIVILMYRPSGLFEESKVNTLGTRRAMRWLNPSSK